MERKNSFRGIQGAISKINPELLRSVITSGTAARGGPEARSPPGAATAFRHATTPLPVLTSACRSGSKGTAPLTIFYNGMVAVFDLPQDKAESILKLAEKGNVGDVLEAADPTASGHEEDLLTKLNGELLPIARKKSLERFFAKRKERYAWLCSPLLPTSFLVLLIRFGSSPLLTNKYLRPSIVLFICRPCFSMRHVGDDSLLSRRRSQTLTMSQPYKMAEREANVALVKERRTITAA